MMVFTMTTDTLIEFYKRCESKKAVTEEDRVNILLGMASEGLLESVSKTSRTREQYKRDLAREFNIFDLRKVNESREEEQDA